MTDKSNVVFVIDDDLAVRQSLKFELELNGLDVCTCASGAEALSHPDLGRACCIVLDYRMPVLDGFGVMAQLAAENNKTPVILITGYPASTVSRRATAAGVSDVLEKPLLQGVLLDRIQRLLSRRP